VTVLQGFASGDADRDAFALRQVQLKCATMFALPAWYAEWHLWRQPVCSL
jgi:hypothetical protein